MVEHSQLQVERLGVSYGRQRAVQAIHEVSLELAAGEFGVLLGPSGCGKSTILNAIAGLVAPTAGRVHLHGRTVFDADAGVWLPPEKRDLGMVFQSYALWPHLSVADNVGYPLKRRGIDGRDYRDRVGGALELVACSHLAERLPAHLSGGQQQRVALARAIVARPQVVLFDEPLSNLDAQLRRSLRDELARLHREVGFTALYVTHDQSEALALGTRVFVMDVGRIVQQGVPAEVYRAPATEYVAAFFASNLLDGTVVAEAPHEIDTAFGRFRLPQPHAPGRYRLAVYPERVHLRADPSSSVRVTLAHQLGSRCEYTIEAASGARMRIASGPDGHGVGLGDGVAVRIDAGGLAVFPAAAHGATT